MTDPIVIVGTLRCGSSLTANIFAAHGAWVGNCLPGDDRNPNGYFENLAIKREIQKRVDPSNKRLVFEKPCEPQPWFRDFVCGVLRREGYRGGPWIVKHASHYWRLWDDFRPKWVLPRRDLEEVFQSIRKAGFSAWASDSELRRALAMLDGVVERLRNEYGGSEIDVARMVGGDFGQIKEVLRHCGLDPDPSVIARIVNPAYWHGATCCTS